MHIPSTIYGSIKKIFELGDQLEDGKSLGLVPDTPKKKRRCDCGDDCRKLQTDSFGTGSLSFRWHAHFLMRLRGVLINITDKNLDARPKSLSYWFGSQVPFHQFRLTAPAIHYYRDHFTSDSLHIVERSSMLHKVK